MVDRKVQQQHSQQAVNMKIVETDENDVNDNNGMDSSIVVVDGGGHVTNKRKIQFRNYIPSDPKLLKEYRNTGMSDHSNRQQQQRNSVYDDIDTTTTDITAESINEKNNIHQTNYHVRAPTKQQQQPSVLQLALQKARSEIVEMNHNNNKGNQVSTTVAASKMTTTKNTTTMDLKRKIQSKLHILEKRTQRAIIKLLREKLEHEATTTAVSGTTNGNAMETID